ncbi:MAG: hypothetical protein EOM24_34935, partial [Chloroflexia bacterium]|nr:hypothetical protein [Chloroflexia bacterium]
MTYRSLVALLALIVTGVFGPLLLATLPFTESVPAVAAAMLLPAMPPMARTMDQLPLPEQEPTTTPLPQVSAGGARTCVINRAGQLSCWGANFDVPDDLGLVAQVSPGEWHTCAVTTEGTLRCWGDNDFGKSTVPDVLGLVAQVSVGVWHTCAVTTEGAVRCWGYDGYGQSTVPT